METSIIFLYLFENSYFQNSTYGLKCDMFVHEVLNDLYLKTLFYKFVKCPYPGFNTLKSPCVSSFKFLQYVAVQYSKGQINLKINYVHNIFLLTQIFNFFC